jgi:hypothetical protein
MRAIMTDNISHDTTVLFCPPGSPPDCSTTVTVTLDSLLTFFIAISDGSHLIPPQPWGLSLVYQFDIPSDSFVVDRVFLPYAAASVIAIIDPEQYRSVTLIASPASYVYQAYKSSQFDFSLGYLSYEVADTLLLDTPIVIDSHLVELPAAVLSPYPNPAVITEMGGSPLKFRFQFPTDSFSNEMYPNPYLSVDIFNIAGEFIRGIETATIPQCKEKLVHYESAWDMKNDRGEDVASGVYVAVGRLYSNMKKGGLLAEDRVKVAIIR